MESDSGWGSRSDQEQPPPATVRRLRLDEYPTRSRAAAEEDWYETERLTGHITGGAASAAATDQPAISAERTRALDWRHADPTPTPSAAQRLRSRFTRRRHRRLTLRVPRRDESPRRDQPRAGTRVTDSEAPESPTLTTPPTAARRTEPAGLFLGFRHGPEPTEPKAKRPLRARARGPSLVSGRLASVVALVLVSTVAATIGIAIALSASPPQPRHTPDAAASLGQAADLNSTATALTAAVWFTERHIRGSGPADRSVRTRRRTTHRRAHRAGQHPSSRQSITPTVVSSPVSTESSSASAGVSSSSSASGVTPSTSSQSLSSESAAPAASAQRTQSTQPAFGQNGTLGPGRGAASTQ
jgi:hypothetical protein